MRFVIGLVLCTAILSVPGTVAATDGSVRVVDDDGRASVGDCDGPGSAHSRIQPAIDAAPVVRAGPANATILICPGVYRDSLSIRLRAVTLAAATRRRPVIMPAAEDPVARPVVRMQQSFVRLQGLRIQPRVLRGDDCRPHSVTLIRADVSDMIMIDSRLVPTRGSTAACSGFGHGIIGFADPASGFEGTGRIHGTVIRGFRRAAMFVEGPSSLIATGNRFVTSHGSVAGRSPIAGIWTEQQDFEFGAARLELVGNTFVAGAQARGFRAVSGRPPPGGVVRIIDNHVAGAASGLILSGGVQGEISDNIVTGTPTQLPGYGIRLRSTSSVVLRGNIVSRFRGPGIAVANSSRLRIHRNDFRRNAGIDCIDGTMGGGTAGTANMWAGNRGRESDPMGLCSP